MFQCPFFALALLLTSTLCATPVFAQTGGTIDHWRGGHVSTVSMSPTFPSSSHYQGLGSISTRAASSLVYGQVQTCTNGSCSARSVPVPVVSSAASIVNYSASSISQYPIVVGSGMTTSAQTTASRYHPARFSSSYVPSKVHYGSTQVISTTPIGSCSASR